MVERQVEALRIGERGPSQQRIGAVHTVPGQLAGDGPVHADLEDVPGLDVWAEQTDGVVGEDFL